MNMGVLILLWVVILVCVNYMSVRFDKTWDVTQEGMFSLSDQSKKVVDALDEDLKILVFYPGVKIQGVQFRQKMKVNLSFYQQRSSRMKVEFINPYVQLNRAKEYLSNQADETSVFFRI